MRTRDLKSIRSYLGSVTAAVLARLVADRDQVWVYAAQLPWSAMAYGSDPEMRRVAAALVPSMPDVAARPAGLPIRLPGPLVEPRGCDCTQAVERRA